MSDHTVIPAKAGTPETNTVFSKIVPNLASRLCNEVPACAGMTVRMAEGCMLLVSFFCYDLSNITRLIQTPGEADQLHKLTAVPVWIIAPGLPRQLFDVIVSK